MGNVYYMDKETFVLKSKQQILVYNYMIEDLKIGEFELTKDEINSILNLLN